MTKENLAKVAVEKDDSVCVSETDDIQLTPHVLDFADQRKAMRHVMKENRDVLRRLAE